MDNSGLMPALQRKASTTSFVAVLRASMLHHPVALSHLSARALLGLMHQRDAALKRSIQEWTSKLQNESLIQVSCKPDAAHLF